MNAGVVFLLFQTRMTSENIVGDSTQEELDENQKLSYSKDSQENPGRVAFLGKDLFAFYLFLSIRTLMKSLRPLLQSFWAL